MLSSVAGSNDLVCHILPSSFRDFPYQEKDAALSVWTQAYDQSPPKPSNSSYQRAWDIPNVLAAVMFLQENATEDRSKARLLASTAKESGAWLHALPFSSCGLHMDDDTIHLEVWLRFGAPICYPHQCCHCWADVDRLATHGLSCRWSEGRNFHHAASNDIILRSLNSAGVPS